MKFNIFFVISMKNFFLKVYKYYIFLILIHNSLHVSEFKYIDDFEFQNYQYI